ncbi:hypothetical protein GOP47_0007990, partial [Adiantum capillus-veneris]
KFRSSLTESVEMLHELLLALVGCTGDVFVDVREQVPGAWTKEDDSEQQLDCPFRLAPDLTFIQPSEREILERLLRLGFYYHELDNFTRQSLNLGWVKFSYGSADTLETGSSSKRASVYTRALANGISEVLAVYRSAVLKVEQDLLSDATPVLSSLTKDLNKFESILPPLHALVQEVKENNIKGGRLLNLLHTKCHCGVPELQTCMQRLLWHGHQVMYRQLAAWMVYGLLQDQHGEFFISRLQHERMPSEAENGLERPGQSHSADTELADWHSSFQVFSDMLPQYIPSQVADSILFVGKAVRILRNPSKSFKSHQQGLGLQNSREVTSREDILSSNSYSKGSFLDILDHQGSELLPQSQVEKVALLIQALKEMPSFHKSSFEGAMDSIRTIAATHLWQLVVVHADLMGHLKALKDYFLLAKGDFFQCFLEESRSLMRLPPRPATAEADLKIPFQQAAVKTLGDDDRYFSRVSLKLPSSTGGASQGEILRPRSSAEGSIGLLTSHGDNSNKFNDGWDSIALEYSIEWPLQLLFTKEILAKYCRVFQYLLRLKRIQLELEKSWAEAMQQDRAESARQRRDSENSVSATQRQQQRMPMWRIRQHMTYLITNLQFYIQVDVIESQWNLLQERVQASKDFTELVRFHQEYLTALISQSFLDIGSVSRILDSIIKLCLRLCRLIENQDGSPNYVDLDQISEEFNKKSNSLYTILRSSKLAGSQRAPFLRQFLLRLNYNSFFEATARGALNVVRPRPLPGALTQS